MEVTQEDRGESLLEATKKQGDSMNVSSIIMYKIPTASLGQLRTKFEKSEQGLDLIEFLGVMVQTMDLSNQTDLLQIIPDLVDFFKSVDINGDGRMEWSEFVMFVIESVVVTDPMINEKIFNVSHTLIQSAASRHGVKVSKVLSEFGRIFIGLGPSILIFQPDDHSHTWVDRGIQLKLTMKDDEVESGAKKDKSMVRQPKDDKLDKALKCMDFVYLGAKEMLIVLRSDMALEFHRFMARTKVASDLIQQNGMWQFNQPYDKIELRAMSWSRSSPKIPWKLYAIGESRKVVDMWTIQVGTTGIVTLVDHEELADHTDFVRDILVINNELSHYTYFVSCGMDKKVHLYDLATMNYKATRTGHTAGVQCLAYDNRSLLLAGGFDYKIIAWDLDAEIDRPIFQLWGHNSAITKIVALGAADRTLSLDQAGVLRMWDSSKANPNDKEARQIDAISYVDDTIRTFDVFTNVSTNFGAAHRLIVSAQGRKQHIYRVEDMTPQESSPIVGGVLFSYNLLMMITVHSHDALFFSAFNGDEQNKMDRTMLHLESDLGNEVMSACLDDRQRKLIVGEASGNISVYNILSGVRLKRTAKNVPFGIRELIYSPDKTIIALAGPGELYVFDELPNEDNVDTQLRYVQSHDVDVVAVSYSHELGLIATADCIDTIKVWNYEFMTVQDIIHNFTGCKISQIKFIEKYPLLLVTDNKNDFYIMPVGPAAKTLGRRRWKVETKIYRRPDAQLHNTAVLEEDHSTGDDEVATVELRIDEEGLGLEGKNSDREKMQNEEEGHEEEERIGLGLRKQLSHSTDSFISDPSEDEEDDEDDEEKNDGKPNKPLRKKAMKEYLTKIRECKAVEIIVQKASTILEAEAEEAEDSNMQQPNRLWELLGKPVMTGEDDDDEGASYLSSETESDNEEEDWGDPSRKTYNKSTSIPFPTSGVRVSAVCGYDDGHVAVVDLTPAMRLINVSHLRDHECVSSKKGYEPRRYAKRVVKETETNLATWKPADIALVDTCKGQLSLVWSAHSAAITILYAIHDHGNTDILTSGRDRAVFTWTLAGEQKGVLTRGRDWDQLFRPKWVAPYSEAHRDKNRKEDAEILNDALGLAKFMKKGVAGAMTAPTGRLARDAGGAASTSTHSKATITQVSENGERKTTSVSAPASNYTPTPGSSSSSGVVKVEPSYEVTDLSAVQLSVATSSKEDISQALKSPSRVRVIGQLSGKVTYHQSNKDAAAAALMEKQASQSAIIAEKERKRAEKEAKSRKNTFDLDAEEGPVPKSQEAVWLDELMDGSSGSHVDVIGAYKIAQKGRMDSNSGPGVHRERKIKTKYDQELQQIDANDPNNWEIHSSNRQRALYGRLFFERDKQAVVKDPMDLFDHKLDNLAGGDFRAFVRSVRVNRVAAMASLTEPESSQGDSHVHVKNWPPQFLKSSTEDLEVGMAESVDTLPDELMDRGGGADDEASRTSSNDNRASELASKMRAPTKEERAAELERHRKNLVEKTYVKFEWETSLRDHVHKTPNASTKSLAGAGTPGSSHKEDGGEKGPSAPTYGTEPVSPVKLTEAQLLAIKQRQEVIVLREAFESRLKITDKISKQSKRKRKKALREHDRTLRKVDTEATMSASDKIRRELKLLSSRSKSTAELPAPAQIKPIEELLPRHSMATLVHNQSTTIEEVMAATRKQKAAEESWVRKMKFVHEDAGEDRSRSTTRSSRKSGSKSGKDGKRNNANPADKGNEKAKKLLESKDDRILKKKEFGPYKTKDLMMFLKTFQSFPPEIVQDEASESTLHISAASESKKEDGDREGEDEDDWDDFSIASEEDPDVEDGKGEAGGGSTEKIEDDEEKEDEEEEDEEVKAARLAEEAAEKERKERQAREDEERQAEMHHASAVVHTNIRLLGFLNAKWISLNNQFKTELQKVMAKRTEDGTLPRNVLISLLDALTLCCPYMPLSERQLCLRLFVLKTPRTVEHQEATEKGLTQEQLKKLKAMFEFFDKDGSGGIDKYEIVDVLQKLADNKKKEVTSDKVNDDEDKGVDLADAEALISSVNGHNAEELDFDNFVRMFKSLV